MKIHTWIMKEFGEPEARMPKTAAYATFISVAIFCIINPLIWIVAIGYLIFGDETGEL